MPFYEADIKEIVAGDYVAVDVVRDGKVAHIEGEIADIAVSETEYLEQFTIMRFAGLGSNSVVLGADIRVSALSKRTLPEKSGLYVLGTHHSDLASAPIFRNQNGYWFQDGYSLTDYKLATILEEEQTVLVELVLAGTAVRKETV